MAETIGRGDMKPSYLAFLAKSTLKKSIDRRGVFLPIILVAFTAAACMPASLSLAAGELDTPPAADARIIPVDASASPVALDRELRSADRALIEAIAANDRLAAASLLHSEFTWIDRDGRGRNKSDLVSRMILLAAGPDANVTLQPYGRVAVITGTHLLTPDNVPAFFARVWVRQPSGWRLLLYQETTPPDAGAPDAGVKDARYDSGAQPPICDNPCRSLPYKPLSSEAQEIVASFMAGEKADFDGDSQTANRILGDDVLIVTPADVQPITKVQRIAAMRAAKRPGQTLPPAVDSMALWVFGNAGVMAADQESPAGEMLRTTRIWAKRDGQWQLAFSQQTLVQ